MVGCWWERTSGNIGLRMSMCVCVYILGVCARDFVEVVCTVLLYFWIESMMDGLPDSGFRSQKSVHTLSTLYDGKNT